MLRRLISTVLLLILALPAAAESPVPDRRFAVVPNMDFYGADLQSIFDTSYDACRLACLNNADCAAFTFNTKSKACFPKSSISDRVPFEGAYSARALPTDPAVLQAADARRADLGFLTDYAMDNVRDLALRIGTLHPAGDWTEEQLLQAARDREAQGDILNAMRWMGAAVSLSDTADQWTDYARLSLALQHSNSSERRENIRRAINASTNAYFRALSPPAQVSALVVLAEALEQDGQGRDMIRALRLAEDIQPRDDVLAMLDEAIGKYGFRIVEHRADNEAATPRICAEFSEPLVESGIDYAPFVRLPDSGLVVQADENQLCIDGVQHGERYTVTFREGMPAASGEELAKDVDISLYIRDRSPKVNFPGRAYILPRAADAALPIETVNLDKVELTLNRVSDRNILRAIQEDLFGRPLSEYDVEYFEDDIAEKVWTGTGEVQNELNQTMTTRLPLGDVLADMEPGIYTLRARIKGVPIYDDPGATQWFVLTNLGLTTLAGTDGLHVFARGLSDADALEGITLTLLSRSNRELATATTDANGHARFEPGLTRGTGGAAPAMVLARQGEQDFAFLSLTDPAFDLSDRGVEGRPAAPAIDVFLATDRGAYRAGDVIHATALARDALAEAVPGLPLTAILTRPDGVEYSRHLSSDDAAGGHVFELPVATTAPRGTWRLDIKADVDADPLATETVLVEDFLPERIDFDLALPETPLRPGEVVPLTIDARYLFGAPGAGLTAEGTITLRAKRELDAFPGYLFGRHDEGAYPVSTYMGDGPTDAAGRLVTEIELPEAEVADRPHEATLTIRVSEGSGRPVERRLTRMLAPSQTMIGIKPAFDGVVPEGAEASLEVIAVGPDLDRKALPIRWTVNRVMTRYQWYQQYGNWNWEPITTRERVSTGEATTGPDPLTVMAPVEWGRYELVVESTSGDYVSASHDFYAGWYAPADASQTPDTLELSLDREKYAPGDTAQLRIVPRYAGTALVTVMSNRVIDMKAVEVQEGENTVSLPVTDDWGAGAYVTAQVIRPMNVAADQNPARALGLSYASIDPGDRKLSVTIDAPDTIRPRGPLEATVNVGGVPQDETGYVTLAAVDVGILNLTGFDAPDPSAHYFGQRRLGVEIRDLYGRLIDGMNGAPGQVRSGGGEDSGMSMESPPPTEDLVAYFTGPLTIGPDGTASASFDIPDFNGTVRLMAIAWTPKAVGEAETDVLIRDPVVVTASLPRFLAPGDRSEMLLEIVHADGPTGRMGLDISADGVMIGDGTPSGIDLGDQEKATLSVPVSADEVGDHAIRIALTTPDGQQLTKSLTLPVRANDPAVSRTRRFSLAGGDTFTLDEAVFAGFRPGTAEAVLSAGPLARLDAPSLLQSLNRYPYGCTEQVASQAMPLLYFNEVASALGLGDADRIEQRINDAVNQIMTRQSSNGAFGLWRAASGDFWLDAYVTDFLSRARAEGHEVPDRAFSMAMDNLRNRVNYAPDFDDGGEDIAYALMVLAREGAAKMGDLRYYADVKANDFGTPLALAQLGAALASYGDQTRADRMFRAALDQVSKVTEAEGQVWRSDYGTRYRDRAGVIALITEARSEVADSATFDTALGRTGPHMSTQEQSWTLLAAHALIDTPGSSELTLNDAPVAGSLVTRFDAETMTPKRIGNTGTSEADITLTTIGVPDVPEPASGYGYMIERAYFDLDGEPASVANVESGTRLVAVLTVRPSNDAEARLIIDDPLPAGLEIDNPNLLRSGDVNGLDWIKTVSTETTEFRSDRFIAAVNWRGDEAFRLAYIVRAVSPGTFHHPAATVEDMYRPEYRAHTDTGRMNVGRR
ncbi:alpha-2-macroglobulin family protein [Roseovarius sp. SCSIO 43702]|uniref:alpha-2-macroglobulin family protein n=1 Tax=Roseovarius sp. SCSIO 43702 TaxID=2823043 RepID=UPI001C732A87|nr:alpha-2-macroglobulin family protein [Roseovarius sp. SCSIO 43702]QYX56962.1 alpha-2-macroglobulin family protein [Roseovarius sp. SCSIO 43702]